MVTCSAASGYGVFFAERKPYILSIFSGKIPPWNPLYYLQVSFILFVITYLSLYKIGSTLVQSDIRWKANFLLNLMHFYVCPDFNIILLNMTLEVINENNCIQFLLRLGFRTHYRAKNSYSYDILSQFKEGIAFYL